MADDEVIADDVVRVSPDLTGFRQKLEKDLAKATRGIKVSVPVVADTKGFAGDLKTKLAKIRTPNHRVQLVADSRGFATSVRAALAKQRTPQFKVQLVADGKVDGSSVARALKAEAAARDAGADRDFRRARDSDEQITHLHAQAIADRQRLEQRLTDAARREGERRVRDAGREASRIASNAERESKRARSELQKATTGPQLIDWGHKGIQPMNALYGIIAASTPALFAMGASAAQAASGVAALGAASIGAAIGVTGLVLSFGAISEALKLRTQTQKEATNAAANADQTQRQTALEALQYQNNLTDALYDQKKAEEDLHKARLEAKRDLDDLKQKARDLAAQERDDNVSVLEAEKNARDTRRNVFATGLEIKRADADVGSARAKLAGTRLDRRQNKEDLADGLKKGIERSEKVTQAKDQRRRARNRLAELKAQPSTSTAAVTKTTSAASLLEQKLKEMSPAARDMYYWFDANDEMLKGLRRTIEQQTLPGFTRFLKAISTRPKGGGKTTLQLAAEYAGEFGAITGDAVSKLGQMSKAPWFRDAMAEIQKNNTRGYRNLTRAGLTLIKPLTQILEVASPLFVTITDKLGEWADRFAKFIDRAYDDGSLVQWFMDARTEGGKWLSIGGNVLTLLRNLFMGSLPAGASLVDRFEKFTATLADWSSSASGQDRIESFFTTFQNLPYGEIGRLLGEFVEVFLAYRAVKFSAGNPFTTALVLLAKSDPTRAANYLGALSDAVVTSVGFVADHQVAVSSLLALLAAAKVAKTIGFGIDFSAGARNLLTSKFAVLDKFLGGSARTAVMNVQAGVVNVSGGGSALPDIDGGGKTKPGKVKPGRVTAAVPGAAVTAGRFSVGSLVATLGTVTTGLAVASLTVDQILGKPGASIEGFKAIIGGPDSYMEWSKKNQLDIPKIIGRTLSQQIKLAAVTLPDLMGKVLISQIKLGAKLLGLDNGDTDPKNSSVPKFYENDMALENNSFTRLTRDASLTGSLDNASVKDDIATYLTNRKKSVSEYVRYIKSTEGPIAAAAAEKAENDSTRNSLVLLGQRYGRNKAQAETWADGLLGLTDRTKQSKTASDQAGEAARKYAEKVGVLKEKLDTVTGEKIVTVTVKGLTKVFSDMNTAAAYQALLAQGKEPTQAALSHQKLIFTKNDAGGLATGGPVRGAGTATSDSIPAWLSHGEYVMPAKTVQHYGVGVMDNMRARKYAAGGPVGMDEWPFKIDVSKTLVPQPAYTGVGGGTATGDENVAEIAERTARAMGATTKQLLALIETGLVESEMRNINYGDRDSVGFLQQRPSQGWGTVKQLMDVAYATRKFINYAKAIDSPKWDAGTLAWRVQRPDPKYRGRYALREADATAIINRNSPYLEGSDYGKPAPYLGGSVPPGYYDTRAGLIAFGRQLQKRGYTVSENPAFGGVDPVHAPGSQHYKGNAIDVNHGAGTSKTEQSWLAKIIPEAHKWGFRTLFMVPGHYNHAHVDLGAGHAKGGLVKPRKYDSGGTLPPGFTLAYNGTGQHETIRTAKQEKALNSGPIRLDRRDIALLAAHIAQAASPTVSMDGRKVAEVTNRYNYLPAGV